MSDQPVTSWRVIGPGRSFRYLGHRMSLLVVHDPRGGLFFAHLIHGEEHSLWSSKAFKTEIGAQRAAQRAALQIADDTRQALGVPR